MLGSMGLAGRRSRWGSPWRSRSARWFGLEGDGSLLMQLGTLGTIAAVKPANLAVIV